MNELPYFLIQRTPESMGFRPGTTHTLKWYDHGAGLMVDVGQVEVVEVADNFLLSVRALTAMTDAECGDVYAAGDVFTAWRGGDHDQPFLTFIPCPDDDEEEYCPDCGSGLLWEDCDACGGEGEYDCYDEDPLWYDPGDTEPCHQCGGDGGWNVCINSACKRTTA